MPGSQPKCVVSQLWRQKTRVQGQQGRAPSETRSGPFRATSECLGWRQPRSPGLRLRPSGTSSVTPRCLSCVSLSLHGIFSFLKGPVHIDEDPP